MESWNVPSQIRRLAGYSIDVYGRRNVSFACAAVRLIYGMHFYYYYHYHFFYSQQCTQENGALLSHPLVSSLIRSKWERFGRPVFYSKFALFAIFLFFLTGYVVVLMPHLAYWLTVTNKATNETTYKCLIREVPPKTFKYFFFVTIAVWIIRVFSCLQLTLEVRKKFPEKSISLVLTLCRDCLNDELACAFRHFSEASFSAICMKGAERKITNS